MDRLMAEQVTFIKALCAEQLDLRISDIKTDSKRRNNIIHHVFLSTPTNTNHHVPNPTRPGTVPIPAGTTRLLFSTPNPDSAFNNAVRVQNSVAAMTLMRDALAGISATSIVPRVYAWSTSGCGEHGWILEEFVSGVGREWEFHAMPREQQQAVLRQIAEMLKALQSFELPPTVGGFGGLAFDGDGRVVNGAMVVEPYTESFDSLAAFYKGMLDAQLEAAERSPVSKGWHRNGLRERIDRFATGRFNVLLASFPAKTPPVLIQGELVLNSLLFDPATLRITALVDYNCTHTGHPLHELFFSLHNLRYTLPGPFSASATDLAIRSALLHGYPDPLPTSKPAHTAYPGRGAEANPQWEMMRMFECELARVGAQRPSSIEGADEMSTLYGFLTDLCLFLFSDERFVRVVPAEEVEARRKEHADDIERCLVRFGY